MLIRTLRHAARIPPDASETDLSGKFANECLLNVAKYNTAAAVSSSSCVDGKTRRQIGQRVEALKIWRVAEL